MMTETLTLLGFVLGASVTSGLRLYATVAVLGGLHRFGVIILPDGLVPLSNDWICGIAAVLYLVEFIADKVPAFDSIWDVVHSFIRIPAATLIAWAAFAEVPEVWRLGATLLCGSVALSAHGLKASARLAINTSPEPASNWGASFAEEISVVGILWLAIAHPFVAGTIALTVLLLGLVLAAWLARSLARLFRRGQEQPASP